MNAGWSGQPHLTAQTMHAVTYAICAAHGLALVLAIATLWLYRRRRRPWLARPSLTSVLMGMLALAAEAGALLMWGLATAVP